MVKDAGTLAAVVLPAQALQLTAIPDYPLRGVWPGPATSRPAFPPKTTATHQMPTDAPPASDCTTAVP
jgi:hypothetical protein